ncbi:MAG: hypothetical protein PUH84_06545 [Firmicutes bacterium]|nr:hypothetical protein [Bacillota bacterium]MDY5335270.1 hypothetical protein [Bacilli bacterium]
MNNDIRSEISKYNLPINKLTIKSGARIIDNKIVVKDKKNKEINKTYKYLSSRAFDYFPYLIDDSDKYEIYPYIDDIYEPREQKAMDLTHLLSLLHSKTTFYREVDIDKNKEIYEEIVNEVDYLNDYYNSLISSIEKEVYMSPSSYLIARNTNIIFSSIYYAKDNIEKWYKMIEDNKNERVSYIHNNINLEHYVKNDKPYLISWNNSRIDNPIYDLLSFYKNHYLEFDFSDLFHYYESGYPLKDEERLLLFIYMAIPSKIEVDSSEYEMCIKINKMIEYLYKTSNLIMNYQK